MSHCHCEERRASLRVMNEKRGSQLRKRQSLCFRTPDAAFLSCNRMENRINLSISLKSNEIAASQAPVKELEFLSNKISNIKIQVLY